jgi:surface antigen
MLGVPPLASALDMRWLADSPVRYFSDQDWEKAEAATRKALDDAADGETVEWEGDSGNRGSITPTSTTQKGGTTCRNAKIVNQAKGMTGGGEFEYCRNPDGTWAVNQKSPEK